MPFTRASAGKGGRSSRRREEEEAAWRNRERVVIGEDVDDEDGSGWGVRCSFVDMEECGDEGGRKAAVGCDWVRRRRNVVMDGIEDSLEIMVDLFLFVSLFTLSLRQRDL